MSPNKAWERQIVEGVQSSGLLPQGEIIELDPPLPDYELIAPGGQIGIELTEYHTLEKERRNTETFNRHLLPNMLERLGEVGGPDYDYLRGTIYIRKEDYFPSPQKMEDKFVEEWVNVIVRDL